MKWWEFVVKQGNWVVKTKNVWFNSMQDRNSPLLFNPFKAYSQSMLIHSIGPPFFFSMLNAAYLQNESEFDSQNGINF